MVITIVIGHQQISPKELLHPHALRHSHQPISQGDHPHLPLPISQKELLPRRQPASPGDHPHLPLQVSPKELLPRLQPASQGDHPHHLLPASQEVLLPHHQPQTDLRHPHPDQVQWDHLAVEAAEDDNQPCNILNTISLNIKGCPKRTAFYNLVFQNQ